MFKPNYNNFLDTILNKEVDRTPLYEHNISPIIIERITNTKFAHLKEGTYIEQLEFFDNFNTFFKDYGYDTVSFEGCLTEVLPFGGALAHPQPGYIDSIETFESYPFDRVKELYIKKFDSQFKALREKMPAGMKAVGGVGNGVFEVAQDICGYENLCIMSIDEPEMYEAIFIKIGDIMMDIWKWFLDNYGDVFVACRFGDDLGYRSNTLISHDDIRNNIIPQYIRLVAQVHEYNIPFILHSCGNIFDVFQDIIDEVKIDAKHSNEDQIAEFEVWVDKYGDKIANLGGIDTDHLVRMSNDELDVLIERVYNYCSKGHGGFAMGSGNSIPDYVNEEKYLHAITKIRTLRGDFNN